MTGSDVCPFLYTSRFEKDLVKTDRMSLFIFTLSALWWLVRDGWRLESWWTVTSWKWMSLKVEHAAAVDTV